MEILGVAAKNVESPATLDEAASILARLSTDKQRVAFVGGGTELGLGAPPTGLDTIVSTAKMARILEYAPSDMVMICEAGVTLDQIQRTAAGQRQRLMLDAPLPAQATIGGLVATSGFGPLRARYGAIRDLIIGCALVRADGRVARSGGKVVKNVAGFDLPKVACGSLGTLGLIGTANFRLHPLPEVIATALLPALPVARLNDLIAAARAAQLEPAAAVALRHPGGSYDLGLRFEGFGKGVHQQMARTAELAHKAGCPCEPLAEPAAADFWQRHDACRQTGSLRARLSWLPSKLAAVESLAAPILASLQGEAFAWYATLGIGFVAGEAACDATITALEAARSALHAAGGSLVLQAAPPSVRRTVDPWGPPPPAFAQMKRLKDNFDPDRRLNPGRFVGGL